MTAIHEHVKPLRLRRRTCTKRVLVYLVNTEGRSVFNLFKHYRRQGDLTVPFHYLIGLDGQVDEGRHPEEIGESSMDFKEDAVIVFLESADDLPTPEQLESLREIRDSLPPTSVEMRTKELNF